MAELGIRKFNDLIGRTDLLEIRKIDHWKAKTVDPSAILFRPANFDKSASYCIQDQIHKIDNVLDNKLISEAADSIKSKNKITLNHKITNVDRTAGAMLSGEISKLYGDAGLPEDTITINFEGSAGQSFGAFLAPGVTFRLEGDANDYFGKGLSGGKLIAVPQKGSDFIPEENIIIGNTVLYGATSGECFVRGIAGERFCVRNSGVNAVVEGTGDHCAEYMTGGRLIVIGDVGRNFAAGMSGGIAYVYDKKGNFDFYCNRGMVELSFVEEKDDIDFIKKYLRKHIDYTDSSNAKNILENWNENLHKFIKVIPLEYKRALQEIKLEQITTALNKIKDVEQIGDFSDG
jgi:glutamate synthase (NADPH/NADH) large chain